MSVPRWLSFALLVAATMPANGNIRGGFSTQTPVPRADVAGSVAATESKAGFLFRSTLVDAGEDWRKMLGRQISMEKWDSLRVPAIPHDDEHTTILPEAGSGILLSIGLLALIGVGRLKVSR